LRIYNSLTEPVAALRLRDRPAIVLDSVPLKCGDYVALWNGTVSKGTRAASPGLYLFNLSADGERKAQKLLFTTP